MGFIYFIQAENGLIKIGFTRDHPLQRMAGIASVSPIPVRLLGVIVADRGLESRIHERYKYLYSHGEWFRPGERLLNSIRRWAREPRRVEKPARAHFNWPAPMDEMYFDRREFLHLHGGGDADYRPPTREEVDARKAKRWKLGVRLFPAHFEASKPLRARESYLA